PSPPRWGWGRGGPPRRGPPRGGRRSRTSGERYGGFAARSWLALQETKADQDAHCTPARLARVVVVDDRSAPSPHHSRKSNAGIRLAVLQRRYSRRVVSLPPASPATAQRSSQN